MDFSSHTLSNGLQLIVHEDATTPMAAVSLLYDVGSRDERPEQTGFAHLFEHLMFGGSAHIPRFDEPLQEAGGENNAFTTADLTHYYMTLPANNIETAFWLESDRMGWLDVSDRALEVQRKVVVEEFRQRCLNQPYGDAWHLLRQLAYTTHPYRWPVIGLETRHIEEAKADDVRAFHSRFYHPANAKLVVAGAVDTDEILRMAEKWFGPIPAMAGLSRNLPCEPQQTEERRLVTHADVPSPAMYKAFHMPARRSAHYTTCDLISDLLAGGQSSRLFLRLTKERRLFSEINAYVTGDLDPGLFVITGKPIPGVSCEEAERAVMEELRLLSEGLSEREMEKVKNKFESNHLLGQSHVVNKAMSLAFYALMGNPSLLLQEVDLYRSVSEEAVSTMVQTLFRRQNCNTLWYLPAQSQSSSL
ncbi:MAG: M16 family metallopeptidase [Bacteroidales bacterium]